MFGDWQGRHGGRGVCCGASGEGGEKGIILPAVATEVVSSYNSLYRLEVTFFSDIFSIICFFLKGRMECLVLCKEGRGIMGGGKGCDCCSIEVSKQSLLVKYNNYHNL